MSYDDKLECLRREKDLEWSVVANSTTFSIGCVDEQSTEEESRLSTRTCAAWSLVLLG